MMKVKCVYAESTTLHSLSLCDVFRVNGSPHQYVKCRHDTNDRGWMQVLVVYTRESHINGGTEQFSIDTKVVKTGHLYLVDEEEA